MTTTATTMQPGERLPNGLGATVIAADRLYRNDDGCWIYFVLAVTPGPQHYATWHWREGDKQGMYGHYYNDLYRALLDYQDVVEGAAKGRDQ